jgi:LmbE family N-acetylglucosaminyl deacetylase
MTPSPPDDGRSRPDAGPVGGDWPVGGAGAVRPTNRVAISADIEVPARALAIGAHPDDIELNCGATLAKWAAAGCEIHHLVLTDGAKGTWDPSQDPASLVATRQEEQRQAALALGGGEVAFLGFPDGELRNSVREQWEVCRWIRLIRPDVLLGHDPWRRYRLHPDHRNAGFIVTDALVAARDPLFFTDQELEPHRPSALLLWEADVVNHVEVVDGFVDAKVRALLAHQSQYVSTFGIARAGVGDGSTTTRRSGTLTGEELSSFEARVEAELAEHGSLVGASFGEGYHLIDEI